MTDETRLPILIDILSEYSTSLKSKQDSVAKSILINNKIIEMAEKLCNKKRIKLSDYQQLIEYGCPDTNDFVDTDLKLDRDEIVQKCPYCTCIECWKHAFNVTLEDCTDALNSAEEDYDL